MAMNDLFDRLQGELDNRNEGNGISPMDLLELPEHMRMIMRKMLRSRSMRKDEIFEFVSTWEKDKRINNKDLEKSLSHLVDQGWLIELGEGDTLGYRVNLRRKKGSTLSDSLWGAIDSKLTDKDNG
jgi:hypothetical protein